MKSINKSINKSIKTNINLTQYFLNSPSRVIMFLVIKNILHSI